MPDQEGTEDEVRSCFATLLRLSSPAPLQPIVEAHGHLTEGEAKAVSENAEEAELDGRQQKDHGSPSSTFEPSELQDAAGAAMGNLADGVTSLNNSI